MRTSTSYVTTLDPLSAVDMEQLSAIKKSVQITNLNSPLKYRVVLRGRKPIVKGRSVNFWSGKAKIGGYDWAGNIVGGIKNATKYDVYIYRKR